MEAQLQAFLVPECDAAEWSASRSNSFTPAECAIDTTWICCWLAARAGTNETSILPGIEAWPSSPVATLLRCHCSSLLLLLPICLSRALAFALAVHQRRMSSGKTTAHFLSRVYCPMVLCTLPALCFYLRTYCTSHVCRCQDIYVTRQR